MTHRILAVLLSALMLLPLAGCGGDTPEETTAAETTAPAETTIAETEPEEINRENAVLNLPKLNFDGLTINLVASGEDVYATDIDADSDGDIVDVAVYNRNRAIEELLGVEMVAHWPDDNSDRVAKHVEALILASDDVYDLIAGHQSYTTRSVLDGYFINMKDNPYIDWENPWWNKENMSEMHVGNNKIFFMQGDISLMRMKSLGAIYFNRAMYEDMYGDPDALYELVFDGKWTLDKFSTMVKEAYSDLNGNGKADQGDRFGAFGSTYKSVEHFQYACGVQTTTKNEQGIPTLTLNNERSINYWEDFYDLYFNNPGMTVVTNDKFADIARFVAGEYLFAPVWFRHADEFRDMEDDYGIVNFPKYAEDEEYRTLIHNGTTVFSVPVTSQKAEPLGAVCEAMGYYNYISVVPTYYEDVLGYKYSRDNYTGRILDLISDSSFTNFGYVYGGQLNGLNTFRNMAQNQIPEFASWYASREEAARNGLAELVEMFQKVEG